MQDDTPSPFPGEDWTKRDAALWYAAQGWPVVPLHTAVEQPAAVGRAAWRCTCQHGTECRDIGKHPRTMQGVKAASADAEVVSGWWDIWPDANIGIATGRPFAFVVDEDVQDAITFHWPDEAAALADVPIVRQQTPNGTHFLFDAGNDFGNSAGGRGRSLGPGIDTRGDGGYIVVAPSVTPSGRYSWRSDPRGPWPMPPEPMAEALRPAPLRATVEPGNHQAEEWSPGYLSAAVAGAKRELAAAPDGTRNHTLNEVAFRLGTIGAHGVLGKEYVRGELFTVWRDLWLPEPLSTQGETSFMKTFDSGWDAGTLRPRDVPEQLDDAPALRPFTPQVPAPFGQPSGTEAPAPVTPFTPLEWNAFLAKDMTKAEWLAGDLFEAGQQVALVGAGKAGKSLLAFELARAIARGLPYLGAPGRPPRRVGYLDHENSQRDIQQRALAFGFEADDLAGVDYYSFPPLPPLDTRAGGQALASLVAATEREVLFLDTVSRMIEGAENDSDTWLNLYRYSLMPLKAAGVATVRLDHFGKDHDRGARGSSAKTQDVDHVWTLTKGEGGSLTLARTHSRTGLGREELRLIRHGEQTEDGWAPGQTRHVVSDIAFKPAEWLWRVEASKRLDDAGVPVDAGFDRCRTELARIGVQASTAKVKDLVRWRKAGGVSS